MCQARSLHWSQSCSVNRRQRRRRQSGEISSKPGGKTDPLGGAGRRRLMQSVRRTDTAPEMLLRQALWRDGLRYRLHRRIGKTTPDLVFARARVAVFVDGCFWHGCPEHYTAPKHNALFWRTKIEQNRHRDLRGTTALKRDGWRVLRFWSCEIGVDVSRVVRLVRGAVLIRAPAHL
jgi:DNA mismatch endonuclease (patch repair protein)